MYMLSIIKLNIPFDGNPTNLVAFLESIQEQADSSNWEQIMMIPDNQGTLQSVTDKYGLLTMENACNHAKSPLWNVCRDTQNSYQFFLCVKYSITKEATLKVSSDKTQYRIGPRKSPSGVCLLFCLIQVATIHTRSTVNTIHRSLFLLDKHMRKVKYNIDTYNQYVKGQCDAHSLKGEN